jgi:hypothetical protein
MVKAIQVMIIGKNKQIEFDSLQLLSDDKTKSNYRLRKKKLIVGKIKSEFTKLTPKGVRWRTLFLDNGKFAWVNIDPNKASQFAIPEVIEYASARVDRYASKIEAEGFWEKHSTAVIIGVSAFLWVLSALFMKQALESWSSTNLAVSGSITNLLNFMKEQAGEVLPV